MVGPLAVYVPPLVTIVVTDGHTVVKVDTMLLVKAPPAGPTDVQGQSVMVRMVGAVTVYDLLFCTNVVGSEQYVVSVFTSWVHVLLAGITVVREQGQSVMVKVDGPSHE